MSQLAVACVLVLVTVAGLALVFRPRITQALRAAQPHLKRLGRYLVTPRKRSRPQDVHGPRWQEQALAVGAGLSDAEWRARRQARMAAHHPERLTGGSEKDRAQFRAIAIAERAREPQGRVPGPRDGSGR